MASLVNAAAPDRRHKIPVVTICVLAATGVVTSLQLFSPAVLPALERVPGSVSAGQWWRLITPLFVHADGWRQIAFNFSAIAVVGTFVERIFGRLNWLVLYFVSGIVGELTGMRWQPTGAGASVAGCGLLGALAIWLMARNRTPGGRFGGAFILLGAAVLVFLRDIHGPPIFSGAVLAGVMLTNRSRESSQS